MILLQQTALTLLLLSAIVPAVVLFVQCAVASLGRDRIGADVETHEYTSAILVPAHDESAVIADTIRSIQKQLRPNDRLIVIADNCSDSTASIARAEGAEVLERQDDERRGKGFALQHGLQHLMESPPDVVVVIDADCFLGEHCLDRIIDRAAIGGRPVQAAYHMTVPDGATGVDVISALAVLVKNRVRPRGMQRMGLPTLLTGSGMAFPWGLLRRVPFAGNHIVEDMQLSVDMALAGHPAVACTDAQIHAPLPSVRRAARTQRTRWEHGHLHMMFTQAPRLAIAGVRECRIRLLALALDICVPPLALFGSYLLMLTVLGLSLGVGAHNWSLFIAGFGASVLLTASILISWWRFGRSIAGFRQLLMVPYYIIEKMPIYLGFLFRRQQKWVRTERAAKESQ